MGISYSVETRDDDAKAIAREEEVSHKDSLEIAKHIKGMRVDEARETLEAVIDEEHPVPMKSHNSNVGHTSNLDGWDAGRFPEKASKTMLDTLENAAANARNEGQDPDEMHIFHVAAHKVGESEGMKPRAMGRATAWNSSLVDIEMVLRNETDDEEQEGD
ncbi:MAG: 50S ribosomal protein L22 [Halobacteria archaeon]|nr:50S ribosomal protein L22 [Halobacteria archaeon]